MEPRHNDLINKVENTLIPLYRNDGNRPVYEVLQELVEVVRDYERRFVLLAKALREKSDEIAASDDDVLDLSPKDSICLAYEAAASSIMRVLDGVVL